MKTTIDLSDALFDSAKARVLSELARAGHLQGGQFHDARIAAICLENGVDALLSGDRDFGRFKALRVANPLV